MATEKTWWRMRRVKHRDGVALCVLSSALLLAGELTTTEVGSLRWIYGQYLSTSVANPPLFVFQAVLALFAFTTAFGAILVSLGGWYFLIGRVGRGRFFVGFGAPVDPGQAFFRDDPAPRHDRDRLLPHEVPDRGEPEVGEELLLRDRVPRIKAGDLDFKPPLAKCLSKEFLVASRDKGLPTPVIHLHPDGHSRFSEGFKVSRRAYTYSCPGCTRRPPGPTASATGPPSPAGSPAPPRSGRCPRSPRIRRGSAPRAG